MTDTSEPTAPLAAPLSRRGFIVTATFAAGGLAACTSTPRVQEAPRERIDREVQEAQSLLYSSVPGAQELAGIAEGLLIIPKIRKVGFFASGAYGEGALLIGPATVDYYSMSAAGVGLTFGAQEFSQALFFLSAQSLQDFRLADGWELRVDASVTVPQAGGASAGVGSVQINRPIQEVVFGQRGLIADASLKGAKYSRIIR